MSSKKKREVARFECNKQIEQEFKKQYASMLWNMTKNILTKISKDANKQ